MIKLAPDVVKAARMARRAGEAGGNGGAGAPEAPGQLLSSSLAVSDAATSLATSCRGSTPFSWFNETP